MLPAQGRSRSLLVLCAACVCAMLLGVHIGRQSQSNWASDLRLISHSRGSDGAQHSSVTATNAGQALRNGSTQASADSDSHQHRNTSSNSGVKTSQSRSTGRKTSGGRWRRRRASRLSSQRIVCQGFPLQRQWDWKVHFNPAAVYDPKRGWVVVMRHEHVWWGASPALAVLMGQDPDAPDVGVATDSQFLLQLDNATLGTDFAQKTYSKAWLKAEDLRPFLWKGGIYATASVWGEDSSFVWECILRVDLDQRRLATEYCFDKMPIRTNVTIEKNWALVVVDDLQQQVLILHQLAPCLVWLRFAPSAPKGLELVHGTCFSAQQQAAVRDFTGAPLTAAQHISGHLVPFPRSLAALDAERRNLGADSAKYSAAAAAAASNGGGGGSSAGGSHGDSKAGGSGGGGDAGRGSSGKGGGAGGGGSRKQREELFLMVHTRHADGQRERDVYSHWGFRFDAATLQLMHVSRGPVASSYMAPDPHDYLVVLSYHFTKTDGADSLLLFYGRNNTQPCFDRIAAEPIGWYEVPSGGAEMNISDPGSLGYELA